MLPTSGRTAMRALVRASRIIYFVVPLQSIDFMGHLQVRSSYGMFIPRMYDETMADIEQRVSNWTGLPVSHQEDMQVRSINHHHYIGSPALQAITTRTAMSTGAAVLSRPEIQAAHGRLRPDRYLANLSHRYDACSALASFALLLVTYTAPPPDHSACMACRLSGCHDR